MKHEDGKEPVDPKEIVRRGYDAVADTYARWAARIDDPARERWTAFLLEQLPEGARVLDLGCGNGLPSTRLLAGRFDVVATDISAAQLHAARRNVPDATLLHADMTAITLPRQHFAAVTAFYSLIHLPRDQQAEMLHRIAGWLQPGGYLVAVLGTSDSPGDVEPDWLGAPMYWSHYPAETNLTLVTNAGLEVISSEESTILEDGQPATFHWVVCRRPS